MAQFQFISPRRSSLNLHDIRGEHGSAATRVVLVLGGAGEAALVEPSAALASPVAHQGRGKALERRPPSLRTADLEPRFRDLEPRHHLASREEIVVVTGV